MIPAVIVLGVFLAVLVVRAHLAKDREFGRIGKSLHLLHIEKHNQ
jgi:hypothetical protein